jgi:hypothetical protein
MPGKQQLAVLDVLAHETPLPLREIRRRLGATTPTARATVKRAVWLLVRQGLVAKRGHGVYALVIDVEALVRARYPHTEAFGRRPGAGDGGKNQGDTGGTHASQDGQRAGVSEG